MFTSLTNHGNALIAYVARVSLVGSSVTQLVPVQSLGNVLRTWQDARIELVDAKTGVALKNTRVLKDKGRLAIKAENGSD